MLREARLGDVVLLDVRGIRTDAEVAPFGGRQTVVSTDVQTLIDEVTRVERGFDDELDGPTVGGADDIASRSLLAC